MTQAESGTILVVGDPISAELARTLDLGGRTWHGMCFNDDPDSVEPVDGWVGAIIDLSNDPESGWSVARGLRRSDRDPVRTLILVSGGQIAELSHRDDLFDDFCLTPFHPSELEARLDHLLATVGPVATRSEVVLYENLAINLETYQASVSDRPLDLTYMEYELLKFLVQNPGKVFSREMLLSRVWGYDYYGGARTVDVHVRRLRAKLGEEHADLIQTVRSVGYRFGHLRWRA